MGGRDGDSDRGGGGEAHRRGSRAGGGGGGRRGPDNTAELQGRKLFCGALSQVRPSPYSISNIVCSTFHDLIIILVFV